MSGIGTYLFFSGSCCRWGLAPPCFETFRDPTVLTIWRPQNNSVKSRTFPMNSINEIHEAGLGKYGCDSKYRTPVCEALRMKFAGWRYSSTLIYYKKQIVRTMGPWSSNERLNSYPWRWFWGMMRHDQTCGYESWGCASRMKSPVYVVEFVFFENVHSIFHCWMHRYLTSSATFPFFTVTFGIIIRFGGLHS